MSAYFDIQGYYGCDRCRSAENHHGHNLLIMANTKECPNYEFDREKIKERIKEEERSEQWNER